MAYDALRKKTTQRDFSLPPDRSGELPLGATGYAPDKWWTRKQAEDKVAEFMKSGGLFGTKLSRADAEAKTLVFLRRNNVGLMAGSATLGSLTLGSWILNEKDQKRILEKVDDVRYDLRLASRRVGIAGGLLAGALGLLGVASIYKTSSDDRTRKFGQLQGNRYGR